MMDNHKNEGLDVPMPDKQYLIECSKCHRFCASQSVQEVMFDQSNELTIIRIDEDVSFCTKCLENQIQEEIQEARILEQRFIYFKEFQSSFEEREMMRKSSEGKSQSAIREEQQEIRLLQMEEEELTRQLSKLKEESCQLKEKFYSLQVEEQKFWEGINKIERRTCKVEEKSLNTKFDREISKNTLEQLSKMSVLHMFLDIKVDDNLAFVQGMAMGKRGENVDISWEEVSVGLGHLLLGLNFLGIKYSYEFKKIQEIIIKGSQSEVLVRGKKKSFTTINNKQTQKSFGELLQILLIETFFLFQHILQAQSIEYSQQFKIPFLINVNECKIVDLFIDPLKIQERSRWVGWTKAMRYFLIDFKHIITVYAINDKYL